MSKWSKEDRNSFNQSEVITNLEKDIVARLMQLSEIVKESQSNTTTKIKEVAEGLQQANESAKDLKNTMNNLAEDDLEEDSDDSSSEGADFAVKVAMIKDLEKMASVALSEKNYSDLYKIERAIQEIRDNG